MRWWFSFVKNSQEFVLVIFGPLQYFGIPFYKLARDLRSGLRVDWSGSAALRLVVGYIEMYK